ncbi:chorismate mutase [Variovorax terrae]|uniref:chorismate mutase n=1 Tax=Variovorax terrae TaxID=2923278 RepID=A0A9X1VRJ8_9BURK|nr:chorismate mutase [Variovorax terrae]MCJ0762491.1 chorismate mutase [Variovorax terrae]
MEASPLQSHREEIDALDEQIVTLLARRFAVTREVGRLKALHQLNAVDAERERQQALRYEALAGRHGLNPALVAQLFRRIIDEVVLDHRAIQSAMDARPAA